MSGNEHTRNIWWRSGREEVHEDICSMVRALDDEQGYRREANLRNLRLYSNLAIMGLGPGDYTARESLPSSRLTLNVVESVIESAKAFISTQRPKIKYLTEGADYRARKRADNLTYFTAGQFYHTNMYEVGQDVFVDGCWSGTGFAKVFSNSFDGRRNEIRVERVFPDEILVDDIEARMGHPRSLYQHKFVEREQLLELFPNLQMEIRDAAMLREDDSFPAGMADPVSVTEAWHLPSRPGAKDGKHAVVLTSYCLASEKWTRDRFPFSMFRWSRRPMGLWGKGIPEMLRGVQIEINQILQKVQRLMNLASSKVFVQKGSKISKNQLNNTEWGLVEYAGDRPPVFATVAAVAPEYYSQLENLYRKAFEIAGVSQMVAQASKPEGLDSGAAFREYSDVQSRRFLHVGQEYQKFYLDAADLMIHEAKAIDNYTVLAECDDELREIKWADVKPDKDYYQMKAWPASLLPDEPAGKVAAMQELLQVEPRLQPYALEMINNPDLTAFTRRLNAPVMVVEKIINMIVEEGEYLPPEPFMDLNLSISQMQYAYLEFKAASLEEERLNLFRRWIKAAQAILAQGATQPAGPMGTPSEQPFQPGGAPPQAASSLAMPQSAPATPVQAVG